MAIYGHHYTEMHKNVRQRVAKQKSAWTGVEVTPQVEVIISNLTVVGEGPHYSSRNGGILYYVDIPSKKVGRYDVNRGKNTFIKVSMLL